MERITFQRNIRINWTLTASGGATLNQNTLSLELVLPSKRIAILQTTYDSDNRVLRANYIPNEQKEIGDYGLIVRYNRGEADEGSLYKIYAFQITRGTGSETDYGSTAIVNVNLNGTITANRNVIMDFYSKEEIDEMLHQYYYTKTEINNNFYNKTQIDDNFYTKTEIDEMLNNN